MQAGAAVLVLCVLTAVGFYVVSIFRDYAAEDHEIAADALANLQEMHRKGDISDEEFRTIESRTHRHPDGSGDTDDSSRAEGSLPNPQS